MSSRRGPATRRSSRGSRELDQYVKDGGNLKDLGKRIRDNGLTRRETASPSPSGSWTTRRRRKKGLEERRRIMDMVQQIGGKRMAAPPAGAKDQTDLPLLAAADRYRDLCDVGEQFGVAPIVEFWGFSKTLSRLGEALLVAVESGQPRRAFCRRFSPVQGRLRLQRAAARRRRGAARDSRQRLSGSPPRTEISDQFRVYPGDGVAPLKEVFRTLHANGFHGFLSLELFNHEYWKNDALLVARTGLEKMKAVAHAALEEKP